MTSILSATAGMVMLLASCDGGSSGTQTKAPETNSESTPATAVAAADTKPALTPPSPEEKSSIGANAKGELPTAIPLDTSGK